MLALSPRLKALADHVLPHGDVWDVCCDHGYVGEAALLVESDRLVNFVDRVPHIMVKLQDRLGKQGRARFWTVDALQLQTTMTGTLVLAGIGAERILSILETLRDRSLLRCDRLVLCPQKDEEMLDSIQSWSEWRRSFRLVIPEGARQRVLLIWDRIC